ncbi:hypothetical protein [Brevundimonas sp. LjRoot202]|uniref:hypothetical protein n=1 Tax=Brevundimonas sp. LjRoot202 TaxID=3342281 RepID=UPI003ED04A9D
MRKLSLELNGNDVDQSPRALFEQQVMKTGKPRVITYVPDGQADLIQRLSVLMPEPFYVLYVLHTPRGEGEPGRYQSTELSRRELDRFLIKYRSFFADDARHDLWVYSPNSGRTLVWDRHNMLFAEGESLDDVISALCEQGFEEGIVQPLANHFHHYRPEYDGEAASLLAEFDWYRTPLRAEDEQ